jgi:hypothetical protein
MLGASETEFDFGTHRGQEFARGFYVAHLGDVFQDDWFFGEQSGGHGGQGGVLGAADAHCSQQRIAAADYEFIHFEVVFWCSTKRY